MIPRVTRRKLLKLATPALLLLKIIRPAKAWTHGTTFPVPTVAAANGLNRQAFFDHFNSSATIDLSGTGNPGYNWYLNNAWPNAPGPFDGWGDVRSAPATPASNITVANSIITTKNAGRNGPGSGSTAGHFLQTAQAAGASYVGRGFVPPMFIQYSMAVVAGSGDSLAWTALWLQPLEFLTGSAPVWTEVDCMEYYLGNPGQVLMSVHYNDFSNQITVTLNNNNAVTNVVDSNFHTYGMLWLPAAGAINGIVQFYLDGVHQTGADYSYASGSQGSFSDMLHMMMTITPGDIQNASWDYIGVWQQ
jgi:hypothetical protein